MRRILYVSEATAPFDPAIGAGIARNAPKSNSAEGVTGLLVCFNANFLQVLEGENEMVDQVLNRIRRSSKHRNIRILLDEEITSREFGSWSMHCVLAPDTAPPTTPTAAYMYMMNQADLLLAG